MSYSTHSVVIGNSIDINIDPYSCESEVRADVIVSEFTSVRLWGQILNCDGEPVPNAMVKLVRITGDDCDKSYEGISHTVSDCDGFYQFDICSDENAWYKVLVGKSNTGKEIIVSSANRACPSCHPSGAPLEDFTDFTTAHLPQFSPDLFTEEESSYATNNSPFNFSRPKDCHSK